MYYVSIEAHREGYSPTQCRRTLTVGELIEILSENNMDTPVYISNDKGYTFGHISKCDVEDDYCEDDEDEED